MEHDKNETAAIAVNNAAAEQTVQNQDNATHATIQQSKKSRLQVVPLKDFLGLAFAPRENLLDPIIQAQSVNMLYAWRGLGKTYLALHMACAMASGESFHIWKAPKPVKVLYIDGEMPASEMQNRLQKIMQTGSYPLAAKNLSIVTPDMNFPHGMPNLATEEGQEMLMPLIADFDLIVVDNISTLASGGKENEAESWVPLQAWALKVRAMGKAVLFIHHSNKSGGQRGTSKKEDIMDTVIKLERPADYQQEQGARFQIEYEKCRNLAGSDAKGFEAHLTPKGWEFSSTDDARLKQVHERLALKMTIREIAEELKMPKSTVHRLSKMPPP